MTIEIVGDNTIGLRRLGSLGKVKNYKVIDDDAGGRIFKDNRVDKLPLEIKEQLEDYCERLRWKVCDIRLLEIFKVNENIEYWYIHKFHARGGDYLGGFKIVMDAKYYGLEVPA